MVTVDTVLTLLHEKRRRYALYYLDKQDGPVPIDDVVKAVAKMEESSELLDVPDEEFRRLEIELQHVHLPKLEPVEFIRYNADERTVEVTGKPPTFDTILTVAKVLERSD